MENAVNDPQSSGDSLKSDKRRREPGPDDKFFTTVNGAIIKFSDQTPKGERILDKAGMNPVSEHVLIQLLSHSSRSIGLDETVDLGATGTEEFRAFKSDRIFCFMFNSRGYEWGADKIPEPDLRAVAHVHDNEVIVLERDGKDVDLKPGDVLDLGSSGTEHLHTEKRLVTVFFENKPREIARGVYTTEQLKEFFGVQEGYVLEFINGQGQLTPLKPEQKIHIKEGMKFFEQVPCGGSS